jgi:hypothetical protein
MHVQLLDPYTELDVKTRVVATNLLAWAAIRHVLVTSASDRYSDYDQHSNSQS